ncbi:hypothetical protein [Mesorhizobium sp. M0195]|uniref:hypothetical protein n=1 Tax=Mesorhizobium sp. M0195 TaxID=2956910 RepID=UPI00333A386B
MDVVTTDRLPPTGVTSVEREGEAPLVTAALGLFQTDTIMKPLAFQVLPVYDTIYQLPVRATRRSTVPGAEPNTHREVMLSKAEATRQVI